MDIKLIEARNPKFASEAHDLIELECVFSHYPNEWMPFGARPNDVEPHGRDIFARAVAGEFGPIAEYVSPPPVVPRVVSMRQARLALHASGNLAAIDAAIANIGGSAQIEWEYATEVRRDSPLLTQVAASIGLTDEELDALFSLAAEK